MPLRITTLAERPEFAGALWRMATSWPDFMLEDPIADLYYPVCHEIYPEYVLVADDDADPGTLVARALSVPFHWASAIGGASDGASDGAFDGNGLPDDGWDGAVRRGWLARARGRSLNRVSAVEITVRPDRQGGGLSARMLAAMRTNAARLGFTELLAPVRPTQKHLEPRTPMKEYAFRTRDDGLPYDPWLRVHVRAGGQILKVARRSMTIAGTLDEWRRWTGLPFDAPGAVEVPNALVPVHVDLAQDHAVYVEPNVWVRHPLPPTG
ncbi:N-acetyltransferase [Streptosporangiaceae bacterium NEAU-GS5]|nr:N-acetyltransferase [Streptosporangiaceae bacterium NEAU-GS5]